MSSIGWITYSQFHVAQIEFVILHLYIQVISKHYINCSVGLVTFNQIKVAMSDVIFFQVICLHCMMLHYLYLYAAANCSYSGLLILYIISEFPWICFNFKVLLIIVDASSHFQAFWETTLGFSYNKTFCIWSVEPRHVNHCNHHYCYINTVVVFLHINMQC